MAEQETNSTAGPNLTGKQLGDYRVLRRLGKGGMAEVYLAEQCSLGRQVALKVLLGHLATDATYITRFQNEARAAASLVHANIVQIYEVGHADGVHFIAQEYVRGKNLAEVMRREGSLEPRVVLDILRQVVAALCKAAEHRIVHRDIKPENIILSHSGEVKVADFGLARVQNVDTKSLTQVGVTMGTPLYMSPEQIEGRSVDSRSDIYSLGITCYHLLAGEAPHKGDTALAVAMQHLSAVPKPLENARPDLPSGLARIVHRMIAKKPEQRPETPSQLLAELRDLAVEAAEKGWAEGPEQWSIAEWVALQQSRSEATAKLAELMKASAQVQPRPWRWGRLAVVLLLALVLGAVLGRKAQPRFYLSGAQAVNVEHRSTPWAQLYQAKTNSSEEAWMAVWKYFPDADPYYHQLAAQGLVRYYLFITEEYGKALPYLQEMAERGANKPSLRPFTQAGLTIAYQRLGRTDEARQAAQSLTSEMKDQLRQSEPRLSLLLETTQDKLAG